MIITLGCRAQTAPAPERADKDDPERRQAMELVRQAKFVDALPLFEKLAAAHPTDYSLRESWAWCLFGYAATLPDAEQRKKVRIRARSIAIQARDLGDPDQLLHDLIETPVDDPAFAEDKDVDQAMKAAESDFAHGDMAKARGGYLRALVLNPNIYEAALFVGDTYFTEHAYGSAGEWYSRAVQIDPNRETAYRYWADALMMMNKNDDARTKLVDAIVAQPYSRASWVGLAKWLKQNNLEFSRIHLQDPITLTERDDGSVDVSLDRSLSKGDANSLAWMAYGMQRVVWRKERFKKEFPNEPKYRHSLKEEVDCFTQMITVLKGQKDYEAELKKLDGSLQALIILADVGMLEPVVLIERADDGIAQDYESYRSVNREKIRLYVDGIVVPKTPVPAVK